MIFAGVDIGSTTGKAVILQEDKILSSAVIPSTSNPEQTAYLSIDMALDKAGLSSFSELSYVICTGYGRYKAPFANETLSEITCHACGAHWICPEARIVIDIGGQDCKVIAINAQGKVEDFLMNDKCAAGTGRFIENMVKILHISLEELSERSLQAKKSIYITSQCSVFAETEVIALIHEGADINDIAAGINHSIAARIASFVRKISVDGEIIITGGVAKNEGLIRSLQQKIDKTIKKPNVDPQIIGALGAALKARNKLLSDKGILFYKSE